jgi:glycosyltransferase involved in cell wall biosynthesis
VPARNEEANLKNLLPRLSDQTHPCTVTVVDDHSTDATAQVVHSFGANLITSDALPSDWTGKNWACWQGARQSQSDILVFLDADTLPSPCLIARLVAEVNSHAGLISVQPFHRMYKWSERLAAIFNLLGAMGARLGRKTSLAFGPVLATTKDQYLAIGGHESVKKSIIEDVQLGRAYERAGLSVKTFAGRDQVEFRMYPHGITQMLEGFTKNLAPALLSSNWLWSLGVIFWFSGVMVASWELPYALIKWALTGSEPTANVLITSVVLYVAYALQIGIMLKPLGNFGFSAALMPLGVVVFLLVFVWSVIRAAKGDIKWKGRTVSTKT